MIRFLAHFLIVLAAWTVVIKYLFPISFALAKGLPVDSFVFWDFWPVVHLWLARALLHWQRYTVLLAVTVSVLEIVIIVTKFVLFLSAPDWTIWTTNWFINKLFILACFAMLLGTLATGFARGGLRWRGWDLAGMPPADRP